MTWTFTKMTWTFPKRPGHLLNDLDICQMTWTLLNDLDIY